MKRSTTVARTSLSSLVAQAADEFLEQLERGEQPDVSEYARRYPEVAGVLPQILPVLRVFQASTATSSPRTCCSISEAISG